MEGGGLIALTSTVVVIVGALAAGAGVGGGGLFLPLYAYILGVGPRAAVPISTSTILGTAYTALASMTR